MLGQSPPPHFHWIIKTEPNRIHVLNHIKPAPAFNRNAKVAKLSGLNSNDYMTTRPQFHWILHIFSELFKCISHNLIRTVLCEKLMHLKWAAHPNPSHKEKAMKWRFGYIWKTSRAHPDSNCSLHYTAAFSYLPCTAAGWVFYYALLAWKTLDEMMMWIYR